MHTHATHLPYSLALAAFVWIGGGASALQAEPASQPPAAPAAKTAKAAQAKPRPPAARKEGLALGREKLEQSADAGVRQGLELLSGVGGEAASAAVVARLRRGLPPQLIEAAIDALVLIGRPSAAPALLELTSHLRAPIRARAVAALGALGIKSAQSALLFALDDPSPEVRAAAVQALAAIGNARALPALFTASDRGVPGALAAVGQIATTADLDAVLEHAQAGDVSALAPTLTAMMARKTFPLDGRLRLVRELTEFASPSARTCLVKWLDTWKTEGAPPLRRALFEAIKRLDAREKQGTAQDAAARPAHTEKAP